MKLQNIFIILIVLSYTGSPAFAQSHFDPVPVTGLAYGIVITNAGSLSLQVGDEIAVFDSCLCVGADVYDGSASFGFSAWETYTFINDPGNPDDDIVMPGFVAGHPMYFRVWRASTDQEYLAVATPAGVFGSGILYAGTLAIDSTPFIELNCSSYMDTLNFHVGQSAAVSGGAIGDFTPLTYSWSGDPEIIINPANVELPTISGSTIGSYTATVTVTDAFECTCTHDITVNVQNDPPNTPTNAAPANGTTGVAPDADLSWTGGDPDGDTVTYDVYFGMDSTPVNLLSDDQSGTTYDPVTLDYATTYYWQIIAFDNHGASTTGPIWNFTTEAETNNPPNTPSGPSPTAGQTNVLITSTLSWSGGDPDNGDTVTYDVYFGMDSTPVNLLSDDQSGTTYDPVTLDYATTYYWQI
ncbi:MAG: hypothetical protein GY839_07420, partial [candidate division Zixibacteria bacterium]|nr:hypothetical protein [candidate division Zixibacteria bacterium]